MGVLRQEEKFGKNVIAYLTECYEMKSCDILADKDYHKAKRSCSNEKLGKLGGPDTHS